MLKSKKTEILNELKNKYKVLGHLQNRTNVSSIRSYRQYEKRCHGENLEILEKLILVFGEK
ncbi:MAG: hypothetical protein IPL26_12910 [Leptospiraceae bacterium]|nr:hypothetical protein [Leptospiraceae bacterium]